MKLFKSYLKIHKIYLLAIIFCAVFATSLSLFSTPYIPGNECFNETDIKLPTKYHLNCDSWDFMASGLNFPDHFEVSNIRMSRPGYPLILNIVYSAVGMFDDTVGFLVQFYGAIFINLLFAIGAAVILYYLCCKIFDRKVAILSSIALLLSTHFHVFLPQVHTEIAGDFVIIACLLGLYIYSKKRTTPWLVGISFVLGLLMLIKFVFALPIFFAMLALYYRKLKELLIFVIILIIPTILWYLFVTKIMDIPFVSAEVSLYKQGTWFIEMLAHPSQWWPLFYALIITAMQFVIDTFWVFLFLPVFLAIHGFYRFKSEHKQVFVLGFIVSFILMVFAMLWSGPRFSFGIFPIIFPLAAYGALELWKVAHVSARTTMLVSVAIVVILSLTNVYMLIPAYDYNGIRARSRICGIVFDKTDWYC